MYREREERGAALRKRKGKQERDENACPLQDQTAQIPAVILKK